MTERVKVNHEGFELELSNLQKVMYPSVAFTKADLIDYYARIGPTMVEHVKGRCVTTRRWPDGIDGQTWFQKNCPEPHPDWIKTTSGPQHSEPVNYCVIDNTAGLVWLANLAAIEIHLPMALSTKTDNPNFLVFDLDPGPGTDLSTCCKVALEVAELLKALNLESYPKTSGQKGLQLYVPLNTTTVTQEQASTFARSVAELLSAKHPDLITANMGKAHRTSKVLIDWSQNSTHKTTVGVYSLRATPTPQVSTPVTWQEVEQGSEDFSELIFSPRQVLQRVEVHGDIFKDVLQHTQQLPALG